MKSIAIIGAGAAGLTAAESLKIKGYTNVTVIEKSDRAGGKCCSIQYEGRSYELGAGIVAGSNRTVLQLAKKYGITLKPLTFNESMYVDVRPLSWKEKIRLRHEALFKYFPLARRYKKITESGLQSVNFDLCKPFSDWATQHKIPLLAKEFAISFTGFGYGYFDEVAAAYVLKYFSLGIIKSFIAKAFYDFPEGIQHLWNVIAKNHHVLYNTEVQKIQRTSYGVKIQTNKGEIIADALILASPLDESLQYLDASPQEKEIFTKISYTDYRTYACLLKDFPKGHGYLPGNFTSERSGHPVMWYQRYRDSNLYTFYILGDWKISDSQCLKNIEAVVHRLGGSIQKHLTTARWKYFPHISPQMMKEGYFDRLEALQGTRQTYYAGELLNFSTVDFSAQYSQKLIERHF